MYKNNILIITPTFNESKNINEFINNVVTNNFHALIVDDNSPDNTSKYVTEHTEFNKSIFLIIREKKLGLGTAYIQGFNQGLKNKNYQYFVEMDADFSHRFEDLNKMLEYKTKFDLIIGSRYVEFGKTVGWSWRRRILSKYANRISKHITNSNINDMTSGFRVYSRKGLESINFKNVYSNGYSFQIEMANIANLKGLSIKEVPIIFLERKNGKSKMNYKITFEAIKYLFKLYFLP